MSGRDRFESDNSPFFPILEGRSNWKEWNQHLEAVLGAQDSNLLEVITGVEKRPEDIVAAAAAIETMIKAKLPISKEPQTLSPGDLLGDTPDFEKLPPSAVSSPVSVARGKKHQTIWEAKNKMALGYLTSTIHDRMSHHIVKGRTAHEVYESLREVCEDSSLLSPCVKSIRWTSYKYQPGESFSNFLNKWRYYLAEVRACYPSDQQVPPILCYHIFIGAVSNNPACVPWLNTLSLDRKTFQEHDLITLYTEFLTAESHRTGRDIDRPSRQSSSGTSNMPPFYTDRGGLHESKYSRKEEDPWCAIHKRRGHTTKECWSNPRNPLSRKSNVSSGQSGPQVGSQVKPQPLRPAVSNNEKHFHAYLSDDGSDTSPTTEPRQPQLTPLEQRAVNMRGGWTRFMEGFGLKTNSSKDIYEGQQIATALVSRGVSEESDD
ncbi:hypothetical protein N7541_000516 [Penicillium brevicompactum]|uniref:Uncharacterized protein n=1 Tax=Penicillium brevicompactum TaxID=5074 RepID=A0A9W9RUG2_PENBR|nr:hypothetical protein N7541_000516 [Penicillium brevicompactum]